MTKRDSLKKILYQFKHEVINHDTAINKILKEFDIDPELILTQDWYENHYNKTGWFSDGWFYPDGFMFKDFDNYEMNEVLETDRHGHITSAVLKYIG